MCKVFLLIIRVLILVILPISVKILWKHDMKLVKKMFIGLLTSIVSTSNHTKCVALSNQKCIIQLSLINLHPNAYSEELDNYPLAVKLDRCVESCNTLNDLSSKLHVPN